MAEVRIWARKYGGHWSPDGDVIIPKRYAYLPAGDAPLTLAVKQASGHDPVYMVMEKTCRRYRAKCVGIWADRDVIEGQRARLKALRTPTHAQKLARQYERAQQKDIEQFCEAIRLRFPGCPQEEAREIAEHTCKVGSGRVGRSRTADDPVRAAVVAHIRHQHSDYDHLLDQARESGLSWEEMSKERRLARDAVLQDVMEVLGKWEQQPETLDAR